MKFRLIAILITAFLLVPSFVVAGSPPTWKDGQAAKERKDYKTAYQIFSKLAESGDDTAQLSLSYFFDGNVGVKKDDKKRMYWLQKSAEQDNFMAQINLGSAYERGEGLDINSEKAFYWYSRAANQGNEKAQFNLGLLYAKGAGVVQNYESAYFWFLLSAATGLQPAIKFRDLVESEISFEARRDIQKRAGEWQPNKIWFNRRMIKSISGEQ